MLSASPSARLWAKSALLALIGCGPAPVISSGVTPMPTRDAPTVPLEALGGKAPLRVAVDVAALRASPDGRRVTEALSASPSVRGFREISGVDPFVDGDWLVAYGTSFSEPKASTLVVHHARPSDELWPHSDQPATRDEAFLRPQRDVVALVPLPEAARASQELAKPLDPALPSGVAVQLTMRDASWRFSILPRELERVAVVVRPSKGGGFDVQGVGDCADSDACAVAFDKLHERATRMTNAVREDLRPIVERLGARGLKHEKSQVTLAAHVSSEDVAKLARGLDVLAPAR